MLGGAITFTTADPTKKRQTDISQTFGSYSTFRTYGRFNSGELNASCTRFYVSYARTDGNLWKGAGSQLEQQANAKLVQPIGQAGKLTAFFGWSNYRQDNYPNMSLNMLNKLGKNWSYLRPDYTQAYNAAVGNYTPLVASLGNATDEAFATYYDAATISRNYLSYLKYEQDWSNNFHSTTNLYAHVGSGDSEITIGLPSPNGSNLSQNVVFMDARRLGGIQNFSYKIARHTIDAGFWYENESLSMPERLYQQPVLGGGTPLSATGPYVNAFATAWESQYNTNTFQFYLQDTWNIIDNLKLSAGFKSFTQTTHGGVSYNHPIYGSPDAPSGSLTASNAFLPHFSINWTPIHNHEFYVDIAENMKAYPYTIYGSSAAGMWGDGNQQAFNTGKSTVKPERTWTYVVGYRYNSQYIGASADFYHVDYYNRAVASVLPGSGVNEAVSYYTSVGKAAMNGADFSATVRPVSGLSIYNMFSLADGKYESGMSYDNAY